MHQLDYSVLMRGNYPAVITDALVTMLTLTALAWVLAMAVGTLLALVRTSSNRLARGAVVAWVEYHQNVPLLVQIFLWYFGIATLLPVDVQLWINKHGSEFIFATIALTLAMSAYVSEDIRGGIRSIPTPQLEAARALGLTRSQCFRVIVLPQALRIALPTLINHTVLLFKGTALAMTIGLAELTYVTREIESESFRTVEIYLFTSAVYCVVSLLIMAGGAAAEKRWAIAAG